MEIIVSLASFFIFFIRNIIGCVNKPYVTYRKLSEQKSGNGQIFYIFLLIIGYFSFASVVKTGLRNPFLLTVKFNLLLITFAIGFLISILIFYLCGSLFKSKFSPIKVVVLWSYSMLPTIIWFFVTSILYVMLPPPRTFSSLGKIYSISFISFSIGLLYWKVILYYLTLRFGLRLELQRIMIVSSVFIPVVIIYSLIAYNLGIYKIPFI
jgi:hypothetical protein